MASSWWIVLASSVLLAGCATAPPLPELGQIAPFTLTDQSGAAFDSGALQNKLWIANFVFTHCPGPCPRMSSQMHQIQKELGSDERVRLVSFTVDPARDTPEVLNEYSKHFEAEAGKWFFLTGPSATLNRVGHDDFKLNSADGGLDHSTRLTLVDGKGRIRGYYASLEKDAIPRLIADARRLLTEKI